MVTSVRCSRFSVLGLLIFALGPSIFAQQQSDYFRIEELSCRRA